MTRTQTSITGVKEVSRSQRSVNYKDHRGQSITGVKEVSRSQRSVNYRDHRGHRSGRITVVIEVNLSQGSQRSVRCKVKEQRKGLLINICCKL